MTAQSGLGFSGIVAIQIPDDGAAGEVLTKLTADNYDYDWGPGGGGGGAPTNAEYVVLTADATLTDERILTAGTGITVVDGGAGGPVTLSVNPATAGIGLQEAYDADTTAPQILINGTPDPLVVQASVAGEVFEVEDVAGNIMFEIDADPDLIVARTGITVENAFSNGAAANSITISDTFTTGGPFIGGAFTHSGAITYNNAVSIFSTFGELVNYIAASAPGFAAYTMMQGLPLFSSGTGFDQVNVLGINMGPTAERTTAGTSTVANTTGFSFVPQTRATVVGAIQTKTVQIAVSVQPTFSTVGLSTANLGTIVGLRVSSPIVALFQPSGGTETVTAVYGIDYLNMAAPALGADNVVVRSGLTANANHYFLRNLGGAQSDFGSGSITTTGSITIDADLSSLVLGAGQDFQFFWAAANFMGMQFNALADQLRFSNPDADRFLIEGAVDSELTLNFPNGVAMGDQSGSLGNAFFNIVGGNLTPAAAGDYVGVLLTHASNYNNNALARGRVSAWVINGFSYNADTGSVTEADTLTVGGMVTSSPGVTITNRQALNVIGGRSTFQSVMGYRPLTPATLAAGTTQDYAGLLTATANNGMRHLVRLAGDGAGTSALGGIDATEAQDGDTFKLVNVSANNVTINHQDAGSVAANRIISPTGANFVLGQDESCEIYYDTTDTRWRILYGSGA